MNTKMNLNEHRPIRRPPPAPEGSSNGNGSTLRVRPYPFREQNTLAALAHCELSRKPGDETFDCPLKALASRLINAEGAWIADMREDEALTVKAVFGLQVEWKAANGARWTGFWTVPLPGGGEIQDEVKAFEQFLAGRPEPKALRAAAESIRRVGALVSGYVADMAARAARPAPWDEPQPKAGPSDQDDVTPHP